MGKLAKAQQLSGTEWRLVLKVTFLLPVVRLGVKLLPFKTVMSLSGWHPSRYANGARASVISPDRLARLVEVVSHHSFLRPTCLDKAVVLVGLLRRNGVEADLQIGVTKTDGKFEAHAWVEHRGQVILGGPVERYAPLLPLEATRRQGQLA